MDSEPVPDDHLIESPHLFDRPALALVKQRFVEVHAASEAIYHGNGVWGKSALGESYPPMYRNTAWRICGYAEALKVADNSVYRRRLLDGGEYLLKEQQPNGSFLWWARETHGHPETDRLLYCTANPGVAFLEAYHLTKDERFLNASARAADWAVGHPISPNNNYNSFAVWHLSEHYRVTGETRYLDSALNKNSEGVYPSQLPNGAWAGHNAWIFYHGIIARGMAVLYGVLPKNHEAAPELRKRLIMAINHILREQRPTGHFRACFDSEEWGKSRKPENPYSSHPTDIFDPLVLHALVYVHETTDMDVAGPLYGILSSPPPNPDQHQGMAPYGYGVGYRWLAHHPAS
ncbi:MAG: hypothetical protein O2954_01830 [bacterium]|nr:hypothetical protein [bacterium]